MVPFRPAPLDLLTRWIWRDLEGGGPVLGIPRENFAVPGRRMGTRLFGRELAAPLGVAAGPHTQLAQNIVAAWLCGARFIELKTVQVLDEIHVSRPCIDAADATYNCEWSQELRVEQSFDEYLKAWVLIHALAHRLGLATPGVVFSASVGYDLAGIQSPKLQRFLARMRNAEAELPAVVSEVAGVYPAVRTLDLPSELSNQVTLSTMHGCPPRDIERIARFLMAEMGLHTWVKLNPTLLGPERLRELLNRTFGHEIEVPDSAFAHDPRFDDAVEMLQRLEEEARRLQRAGAGQGAGQGAGAPTFGVKLSNTLEVQNRGAVLPEKTAYLSGYALHPLTLTLAHLVGDALDGRVRISFAGGADAESFPALVARGLGPVTVCSDLLKPGGYARLQQYLENLAAMMDEAGAGSIAELVGAGEGPAARLARRAREVLAEVGRYGRRERPPLAKGPRPLGPFDCIAAPCQEACPSHQNIPDYLFHVAQGSPDRALEVVLRTNPLPGVTGSVCDHPCVDRCVRNHYDAPLAIRELKRFAVENASRSAPAWSPPRGEADVAIVGAGPAGLSAVYFLARAGISATIFEAREQSGGMVSRTIPRYRLAEAALAQDVERIRALGVEVRLGQRLGSDGLAGLRAQGFQYVVLALGAQAGRKLGIPGEQSAGVMDALEFLEKARAGDRPPLGRRVLVVGGGNSAMDAARSARRLADGSVALVYRRTRAQMPADPTEVRAALEEGVELRDLLAPLRVKTEDGKVTALVCARMALGPPDASGRPRPVPIPGVEIILPCHTILVAVGQEPVIDFPAEGVRLARGGTIEVDPRTMETSAPGIFAAGDVVRGPSSVIQAIADGRAAAEEIARRHGVAPEPEPALAKAASIAELLAHKGRRVAPRAVPVLPAERRAGFEEVVRPFGPAEAAMEASRCLQCDELCSLCVTVCPNRANQAYRTAPLLLDLPELVWRGGRLAEEGRRSFAVRQAVQIVHIADFCNQCGNCTTFCPTAGAPWKEKPRFWLDPQGFAEAEGDAYRMTRSGEAVVLEARIGGARHRLERRNGAAEYMSDRATVRWKAGSWELLEASASAPLAEGERIELSVCATLIALLDAERALPDAVRSPPP